MCLRFYQNLIGSIASGLSHHFRRALWANLTHIGFNELLVFSPFILFFIFIDNIDAINDPGIMKADIY